MNAPVSAAAQTGKDAPADIGTQDARELRMIPNGSTHVELDPSEVFVPVGEDARGDECVSK
ncbi:hypothetical protein [Streptomyces sp. AC555_RSS877]|uniref:hypothetical protein n=1 Tax=Streptomyces sp. AC555_RSS877 TaxID=2823688 RepID=UPI001C254849|nr:hypothetical protein [Streptomyces sp. AC555_RSS877]